MILTGVLVYAANNPCSSSVIVCLASIVLLNNTPYRQLCFGSSGSSWPVNFVTTAYRGIHGSVSGMRTGVGVVSDELDIFMCHCCCLHVISVREGERGISNTATEVHWPQASANGVSLTSVQVRLSLFEAMMLVSVLRLHTPSISLTSIQVKRLSLITRQ